MSGFSQGTKVGTLPFSGKTKEPECLDFKGFQAPKEQGMRESKTQQKIYSIEDEILVALEKKMIDYFI